MSEAINPDALHHELDRLPGWEGTTEGISRTFTFDDFAGAMAFVNRVAEFAERENHHPDITVNWNKVTLTYVTHSLGGVTQVDIEQAREVTDLGPGNDPDEVETKPDR